MARPLSAKTYPGFVALTSVIILGAIGVVITATLLTMSTSAIKSSSTNEYSFRARSLASACAESALLAAKETGSLPESGNLSLNYDACSYTKADGPGGTSILQATGLSGDTIRKLQVTISTTTPNLVISSYQEVADF